MLQDLRSRVSAKGVPQETSSGSSRLQIVSILTLVAIAVALILPVWIVPILPLVDYPDHLARAFIARNLNNAAFHFQGFYQLHWHASPNLLLDGLLSLMMYVFPPLVAGRVVLSICLLAVPLAAWVFLRQANPGQQYHALWTLCTAYNPLFLCGFLGFHLSLAGCLLILALWLKWRNPSLPQWVLLLLLTTLTYLAHLVGFAVAGFVVAAYSVAARLRWRSILVSFALFLPGCLFYLWWKSGTEPGWPNSPATWREMYDALATPVSGYSISLTKFLENAIQVTWLALWYRNPEFRWNLRWLVVFASLCGLYVFLPSIPGQFVHMRLAVFLFPLFYAIATAGKRARTFAPVALVIFGLQLGYTTHQFVVLQPRMLQLESSITIIPPNAPVVAMVGTGGEQRLIAMNYAHFFAYGVTERGWLTPSLLLNAGRMQPHLLQLAPGVYSPPFWMDDVPYLTDWRRIRRGYDYIWTVAASHRAMTDIRQIADPVLQDGDIRIFKVRRIPTLALR